MSLPEKTVANRVGAYRWILYSLLAVVAAMVALAFAVS